MLFAIHALDGTDGPERRRLNQPAHTAHLATAADYGVRIVTAGPLVEDDGTTMKGSLLIVEAEGRSAVEAFTGADPYLTGGVWGSIAITAFQNVADTLQAIHSDARALRAAVELERTSRTSMELIGRQLSKGYVDRLALLTAQQNHHQATMALAQAQAARLGDTAALFQALGGGWWNRVAQASPGE